MSDRIKVTPIGENILEVEAPSTRITTVEELIARGKVDLKIWKVDNFLLNSWEVGAKNSEGDLVVEPLNQVKAWFRRRDMKALAPVVQPIQVNRSSNTYTKPANRQPQGIQKALILPDPHFGFRKDLATGALLPFHDMRALDVAVQVAYDLRPQYVIHLGDILDLAEWSDKFPRSPEFQQTTQAAVLAANWWLGRMKDAIPGAAHVLLEGNHDKRMELALINHLKAAYDLRPADQLDLPPAMSVQRLLALHDIGVSYQRDYPNGEYFLTPELLCVHGDAARQGGGKTVAAVVKNHDVNMIQGHIHRIEQAHRTTYNGERTKTIGAYSAGCLCHIDGRVPGRKARQDWQQGFAVAYFGDGIDPNVLLYQIKQGQSLFGNSLYTGEDRTFEMAQDTGWDF